MATQVLSAEQVKLLRIPQCSLERSLKQQKPESVLTFIYSSQGQLHISIIQREQ